MCTSSHCAESCIALICGSITYCLRRGLLTHGFARFRCDFTSLTDIWPGAEKTGDNRLVVIDYFLDFQVTKQLFMGYRIGITQLSTPLPCASSMHAVLQHLSTSVQLILSLICWSLLRCFSLSLLDAQQFGIIHQGGKHRVYVFQFDDEKIYLDPKWPNQASNTTALNTGLDFTTLFPENGDTTPHGSAFYYNYDGKFYEYYE